MCCGKCGKAIGVVVLLFGIAFLLQDLGVFALWGLNWWTIGFLLAGIFTFCCSCCKGCEGSCCASECCEEKPAEVKAPVTAPAATPAAPAHKKK
jgi:hypothetical protein